MALEVPMRFARGFSPGRLLRVLYSPKRAFTEARSHPTQLDWIVPAAGSWAIAIFVPYALFGGWELFSGLPKGVPLLLFLAVVSTFLAAFCILVIFDVILGRDLGFKASLVVIAYTMVLDSLEFLAIAILMALDSSFAPDTTLSPLVPDHWKQTTAGKILVAADPVDLWRTFLFERGTTVMAGRQDVRWVVVFVLWGLWTAARAYNFEITL